MRVHVGEVVTIAELGISVCIVFDPFEDTKKRLYMQVGW
jgi:hypothetical protein